MSVLISAEVLQINIINLPFLAVTVKSLNKRLLCVKLSANSEENSGWKSEEAGRLGKPDLQALIDRIERTGKDL